MHFTKLLLSFCLLILIAATQTPPDTSRREYYLDPSQTSSVATGDQSQPFTSLSQAFTVMNQDLKSVDTDHLEITLHCRESTEFVNLQDHFSLQQPEDRIIEISLKITTYNPIPYSTQAPVPLLFIFDSPSAHLILSIPHTKLIFNQTKWKFDLKGKLEHRETVLIDGESSELLLSNNEFNGVSVKSNNEKFSVFRTKCDRVLVKKSTFQDIDLSTSFFQLTDTPNALLRFELNKFRDIKMKDAPFLSTSKASSLDFIHNEVANTVGPLISANACASSMIYYNTLENILGRYPFELSKVENIMVSSNTIKFQTPFQDKSEGVMSLEDFHVLRIDNTTLEGYTSDVPAIAFGGSSADEAEDAPGIVWIEDSKFIKNTLEASEKARGLAIIKGATDKKLQIHLQNILFEGNIIQSDTEITVKEPGSSTLWISCKNADLRIVNSIFKDNIASTHASNLFGNVHSFSLNRSLLINNIQESGDDSEYHNFVLSAENILLYGDDFIENSAFYGGGVSILRDKTQKSIKSAVIERCSFFKNKANTGGAIYLNITSKDVGLINLKDTNFWENKAPEAQNCNAEELFSVKKNKDINKKDLELYMKVFVRQNMTEKVYRSGELRANDTLFNKVFYGQMEFFVSDSPYHEMKSNKTFLTSYYLVPIYRYDDHTPVLRNSFLKKETNSKFGVDFPTFKELGRSVNRLEVLMESTEDSSESYFFIFYIGISDNVKKCASGEIYIESQDICQTCPANTFSISSSANTCFKCPPNADCSEGGNKLKILPGYWRNISNEDVIGVGIFYCGNNNEKCLGGLYSQCEEGYTGPLCSNCVGVSKDGIKYRRYLKDYCKECSSKSIVDLLADVFLFIAPTLFLSYTLYILLDSKEEPVIGGRSSRERIKTSLFLNLLLKFMRSLFIVSAFGFDFPKPIMYIVHIFANPSYSLFGYLTCFLKSPFQTSLPTYLSYFFLVSGCQVMISCLLVRLLKPKQINFEGKIKVIMIWTLFFQSIAAFDVYFSLMTCKQVGKLRFLKFDMSTLCADSFFYKFKDVLQLPLTFGIFLIFTVWTVLVIKGKMRNESLRQRLQMIMFRKSDDFISDGEKPLLFYNFETFGEIFLLLISTFEGMNSLKYPLIIAYYLLMLFFNTNRRIAFFHDWKGHLYWMENLLVMCLFIVAFIVSKEKNLFNTILSMSAAVAAAGYGIFLIVLVVHNCFLKLHSFKKLLEGGMIFREVDKRRKSSEELTKEDKDVSRVELVSDLSRIHDDSD